MNYAFKKEIFNICSLLAAFLITPKRKLIFNELDVQ